MNGLVSLSSTIAVRFAGRTPMTVLLILVKPLKRVLAMLCQSGEATPFWVAFTIVMLYAVPLFLAVMWAPVFTDRFSLCAWRCSHRFSARSEASPSSVSRSQTQGRYSAGDRGEGDHAARDPGKAIQGESFEPRRAPLHGSFRALARAADWSQLPAPVRARFEREFAPGESAALSRPEVPETRMTTIGLATGPRWRVSSARPCP